VETNLVPQRFVLLPKRSAQQLHLELRSPASATKNKRDKDSTVRKWAAKTNAVRASHSDRIVRVFLLGHCRREAAQ
jgi:hypothetical protein